MRLFKTIIILTFLTCNTSAQKVLTGKNLNKANLKFESHPKLKNQNFVNTIFRDSKGYLWLGSATGVMLFNSYQTEFFVHDKNIPNSLSNNFVSCILEDRKKNLWIGTDAGLNLFNRDMGTFHLFEPTPGLGGIKDSIVHTIFEDNKGNLWIGTNNGLSKYDYEKKQFTKYYINNASSKENEITSIKQDSKGRIWFVTFGYQVWNFNPETGKFTAYGTPDLLKCEPCIKKITIDKNDVIWIATRGCGLISFSIQTGSFKQYNSNGDGTGTNGPVLLDVVSLDENFLLIGNNGGGINRLNKIKQTFDYITSGDNDKNGLPHPGIYCFHRDKEGILWVATSRGGILWYNPKIQKFKLFRHDKYDNNTLINNTVGCFLEDSDGLIWVGTDGGGISVFNPATNTFKHLEHDPNDPYSLSGNFVRSIKEDHDKNIWIGTWNEGLNRYDKKTGRFQRHILDKTNLSAIPTNTIWNICIDHSGCLWLAYFPSGMGLFDPEKGTLKSFFYNPNKPNELPNRVLLIQQDTENNVWICASNGLFLYNYSEKKIRLLERIPCNYIKSFLKDKDGNLWVGSEKEGLFYCRPDGSVIETFNTKNGFPNNQIWAIVEDNIGNIWISTNNGLCRYLKKTKKVQCYSEADGLQGEQFMEQSFLKARNGQIYFGGVNGFNSFSPEQIKDNVYLPLVYITGFEIFNKPVSHNTKGSPLKKRISETDEITLSYKQSVFSFAFTAINYTNPEKNLYAYKMENFEKDWNYTNASRRYATYTNLDPGEYIFRVKASNNDGIWNEKGASLKIIITPPFWKALWIRILAILSILGIGFSLFKRRITKLYRQKLMLEQKVRERTTELVLAKERAESSTRAKSIFLANMSHELRTPLNAILGLSEILTRSMKDPVHIDYLSSIRSSGKTLLELINSVLDLTKIEAGKLTVYPKPCKITDIINEIINIFKLQVKEKGIELNSSFSENIPEYLLLDDLKIKQILLNLINNAIKYTNKGSILIEATVKAIHENKVNLELSVSDTGIGISPEFHNKIFEAFEQKDENDTIKYGGSGLGLAITKQLVELLNGTISLESDENKGSKFIICLNEIPIANKESEIQTNLQIDHYTHKFSNISALVVDDNINNRKVISGFLKEMGISVFQAYNGKMAVEWLLTSKPDIIFLDIRMPEMDGFETLKQIKTFPNLKNIPTIAITASAFVEDEAKAIQSGFDGYLRKPITIHDIIEALTKQLKSKLIQANEPELKYPLLQSTQNLLGHKEFIKEMEESVYPLIKEMEKIKPKRNIVLLAEQMTKLGQKYSIPWAAEYGKELLHTTETSNIEKQILLYNILSALFDRIKNINLPEQ